MENQRSSEREPAQWELMTNEQDTVDLQSFLTRIGQEGTTGSNGMLLRRAGKPIGFIMFDLVKQDDKNILFIPDLEVEESERSAGVTSKLITAVREYAHQVHATHIGWTSATEIMDRISSKLDPEESGGNYLLPIAKLDRGTLAGRI